MTNLRDLIKRLADCLHEAAGDVEGWGNYASSYFQEKHDLSGNVAKIHAQADEAHAYLAQPEPEGPTDEPLGDLIDKWVQEAFRKKPYGCTHPTHTYVACKAFEHGRNHAARTALSQPEPILTVENCSNMRKHRFNFLDEDHPGQIILDGCFTREDLIEIAGTAQEEESNSQETLLMLLAYKIAGHFSTSRPGNDCVPFAKDVIIEIAAWLRKRGTRVSASVEIAGDLEREAER